MKHLTVLMAGTLLLLCSCNNGHSPKTTSADRDSAVTASADTAQRSGTVATATPSPEIHDNWDVKLIRTAEVTVELKNFAHYNSVFHQSLKRYGAYIAQEDQKQSDFSLSSDLTIKVPVQQFDELLNSLGGDSARIVSKKITAEDVTGEVVDTRSRMEAKKQVRDRYLQLLKQAGSMKEILTVQKEINSIQEDIEAASGRVDYLQHESAYSTLHLNYFQPINGGSTATPSSGFFKQLSEAFNEGASATGNLLIFIITIWPLWLAGALLVLIWRRKKGLLS